MHQTQFIKALANDFDEALELVKGHLERLGEWPAHLVGEGERVIYLLVDMHL